jgi:hypothetical protein
MTGTPIYGLWEGMIARCYRQSAINYHIYGGRGIFVCDRWLSFENFYADMGDRPNGLSLERKDNDGPYSPENCTWATRTEQSNNTRRNVRLTFNGETLTITQWSSCLGIDISTIRSRIKRGMPVDRILHRGKLYVK